MSNKILAKAKKEKNDEFYTRLEDIEKEMVHYKSHFKDKVVYCNCDDPYESNFPRYFALNFKHLGLKALIGTCYDPSKVAGTQFTLDDWGGGKSKDGGTAYYYCIDRELGNGINSYDDFKAVLKQKSVVGKLKGNGDFRSDECVQLLAEADIVVTNPPFSLFREYISQLMFYEKKFIILGNNNAITYRDVFPLIRDNKVWLGCSVNKSLEFVTINDYELKGKAYVDSAGFKHVFVPSISWFTNLAHDKRNEKLILWAKYDPIKYPKYDNYDAIDVSVTNEIPYDYDGIMGVPITFLGKYNPEQFEILGDSRFHDGSDKSNDINYIDGKCGYRRILIRRK